MFEKINFIINPGGLRWVGGIEGWPWVGGSERWPWVGGIEGWPWVGDSQGVTLTIAGREGMDLGGKRAARGGMGAIWCTGSRLVPITGGVS